MQEKREHFIRKNVDLRRMRKVVFSKKKVFFSILKLMKFRTSEFRSSDTSKEIKERLAGI